MRYDVEIGGVTRHVTVVRSGDGFAVTLDGQTFQIDAARIDGHTLSLMVDRVWLDGRSPAPGQTASQARAVHDVTVAPEPGLPGTLSVQIGTTPMAVTIDGRRRLRAGAIADTGTGPQHVVAPMPGKVVRVLAAAGDAVKARQPLVVVEAMKMENELRADRDGVVAEVHAREGLLVEAGSLLVVINPGAPAPRSLQ